MVTIKKKGREGGRESMKKGGVRRHKNSVQNTTNKKDLKNKESNKK